jgi:hypothetical protein
MAGKRTPQMTPRRSTYITKPKAVAKAPRITRAAVEVMPTVSAAAVRTVARMRLTQICSASVASCFLIRRQ